MDSFELRRASLRHARNEFAAGHLATTREEKWWGGCFVDKKQNEKFYYQLGNRLTFLKFMNEKKDEMGI